MLMGQFFIRRLRQVTIILALCLCGSAFSQAPSQLSAFIKANDIAAVQKLLTKSNSNSVDEEGDPLLMNAALYASADMMVTLLKKGANPNPSYP